MIMEEIKQEKIFKRIKNVHSEKNSKKACLLNQNLIKYSTMHNQSEIWLSKQKNMESKKILFIEEHKKNLQKNLKDQQDLIIEKEKEEIQIENSDSDSDSDNYENRYYTKNFTKCFNCNQRGHQKRDCLIATNTCYYCLGNHMRRDCLENFLCFLCNKNGHSKFACPLRGKSLCYKCKSTDHKAYECEESKLEFFENNYRDSKFAKCIICFKIGHLNCKGKIREGKNLRDGSKSYDMKIDRVSGKRYRVLKDEEYGFKKRKGNNLGRNDGNYKRNDFSNNFTNRNGYSNKNYDRKNNNYNSNKNYDGKRNNYSNKNYHEKRNNYSNKKNYSNKNDNINNNRFNDNNKTNYNKSYNSRSNNNKFDRSKHNNYNDNRSNHNNYKDNKSNHNNYRDKSNYGNKFSNYSNNNTRSSERSYKKNKTTENKYISKFGSKKRNNKTNFFDQ